MVKRDWPFFVRGSRRTIALSYAFVRVCALKIEFNPTNTRFVGIRTHVRRTWRRIFHY